MNFHQLPTSRWIKSVLVPIISLKGIKNHQVSLVQFKTSSKTSSSSFLVNFLNINRGPQLFMNYHQSCGFRNQSTTDTASPSLYDLTARDIHGKDYSLSDLKGKVCLIVNTASSCGFTKQFEELQQLYDKYGGSGKFEIIAFPSNSFNQETGSNEQVCQFAKSKFNVTFKIMEKIDVNGDSTHPVYQYLKEKGPSGLLGTTAIKWNFTKFLIDKNGKIIARYAPTTAPSSITKDIEKALEQ
ncbi:hypothetical protein C9374_002564 [Naegleria lovaniensis]|uniref:Glutathione peroxidase n=1 Tax=Naegleria lovaniensis TaxID=51637 RepID=A0AA88GTR3_NAELO|nr:uncharacterized protein C9374_002564 [Naegleria lovaniensis]KAG2386118.1 hypothetical protein C9374_002564 [Naegleria lovaniensis]